MKKSARLLVLVIASGSLLLTTGCTKLRARDQLNRGVQAYKSAHYEEAVDHFQKAVELDPNLSVAKLYLATAYQQQFTPNLQSEDNLKIGQQAIDEYQRVLQDDPGNKQTSVQSLKGIASVYFSMGKLEQARDYQKKVLSLDPNDPEAYYTVGVIDWKISYINSTKAHAAAGQQNHEEAAFKDKSACDALKQVNQPIVDDGMDALQKAINLRTDYDDAMAYLNLLYRRKADIECDSPDARAADLKQADDWSAKTMEVKKIRAEKEAASKGGGIVLDDQNQIH